MRKSSIVQEYKNLPVNGISVMKEKVNFLCSKMMDIEDNISINEPFDKDIINSYDSDYKKMLYDTSYDNAKKNSILSLEFDKSQSKIESDTTTKWIFKFDSKYLLREYLYNEIYTLNPQSPFRLINLDDVPNKNISKLCYDYIDSNLMDRYKLKQFDLYVENFRLSANTILSVDPIYIPSVTLLSKTPVFSLLAVSNINKKSISTKQYSDGMYEISYKQDFSSQYDTFVYYFNVSFERI